MKNVAKASKEYKLKVKFYRSLSTTDIQNWENRRMTGLNMTWAIKDKHGNVIKDFVPKSNLSGFESHKSNFRLWVKMLLKMYSM